MTNPLLDEWTDQFEMPPFSQIKNAHFEEAFNFAMVEAKINYKKIYSNKDAPTFKNTIEEMEKADNILNKVSRVFFNLIKNSIESIQERHFKTPNFAKKIDIVIINKSDYIEFIITDNGTGFSESNLKNILKPYYTTKSKGSGLGLSIVNKIINDHEGTIEFKKQNVGAKIIIKLPKNVD